MYGARPLKRYLQKNVETLAARLILAGNVGREDTILIDVKDGKLTADVKGRIVFPRSKRQCERTDVPDDTHYLSY